jgi:hypothetical protein
LRSLFGSRLGITLDVPSFGANEAARDQGAIEENKTLWIIFFGLVRFAIPTTPNVAAYFPVPTKSVILRSARLHRGAVDEDLWPKSSILGIGGK